MKRVKQVGTIRDLEHRDDLIIVTDSQDVEAIREFCGGRKVKEFDGFLVKAGMGDYEEVYGFHGIVPNLDKPVWQVI